MANPEQMMESMARSIPERTGKSVEEWIALIQASGLTEARDRRA